MKSLRNIVYVRCYLGKSVLEPIAASNMCQLSFDLCVPWNDMYNLKSHIKDIRRDCALVYLFYAGCM